MMNNAVDTFSTLIAFITDNFWTVKKDTSLNSKLEDEN